MDFEDLFLKSAVVFLIAVMLCVIVGVGFVFYTIYDTERFCDSYGKDFSAYNSGTSRIDQKACEENGETCVAKNYETQCCNKELCILATHTEIENWRKNK